MGNYIKNGRRIPEVECDNAGFPTDHTTPNQPCRMTTVTHLFLSIVVSLCSSSISKAALPPLNPAQSSLLDCVSLLFTMDINEKITRAEELKNKGNACFKQDDRKEGKSLFIGRVYYFYRSTNVIMTH
jgi:hypothetical protein